MASGTEHSPGEITIHLLGEVTVEVDGRALAPLSQVRVRELLCFLALDPGPHPRADLATRFWPDVLEASARASLRTALHGLRRALGAGQGQLIATREQIGLGEGVRVDARMVVELAEQGRTEEALGLCRGELLPGLSAEWALWARDEHRELVGELHERVAREAESRGDLQAALRSTRRQLELDPLSEEATRRLMRRLAHAGDRPAALTAYSRLEARLRGELGVAPSAATRDLAAELRTRSATGARAGAGSGAVEHPDDAPTSGVPPARPDPTTQDQDGRDRESDRSTALHALDAALDAYVEAVGAIRTAIEDLGTTEPERELARMIHRPPRDGTEAATAGDGARAAV